MTKHPPIDLIDEDYAILVSLGYDEDIWTSDDANDGGDSEEDAD